jgi:hypothetical protein
MVARQRYGAMDHSLAILALTYSYQTIEAYVESQWTWGCRGVCSQVRGTSCIFRRRTRSSKISSLLS